MEIFTYISAHQGEFMALAAALLGVGGIIVKLTPTKTDDAWFQKIKGLLGKQ